MRRLQEPSSCEVVYVLALEHALLAFRLLDFHPTSAASYALCSASVVAPISSIGFNRSERVLFVCSRLTSKVSLWRMESDASLENPQLLLVENFVVAQVTCCAWMFDCLLLGAHFPNSEKDKFVFPHPPPFHPPPFKYCFTINALCSFIEIFQEFCICMDTNDVTGLSAGDGRNFSAHLWD